MFKHNYQEFVKRKQQQYSNLVLSRKERAMSNDHWPCNCLNCNPKKQECNQCGNLAVLTKNGWCENCNDLAQDMLDSMAGLALEHHSSYDVDQLLDMARDYYDERPKKC